MAEIRVELHEEAIAEARAAREWYAARSPAAADAFMAELDQALQQIAKFPEAWAPYVSNTRRYLLRRYPFSVVYRRRSDWKQHQGTAEGKVLGDRPETRLY